MAAKRPTAPLKPLAPDSSPDTPGAPPPSSSLKLDWLTPAMLADALNGDQDAVRSILLGLKRLFDSRDDLRTAVARRLVRERLEEGPRG